MKMEQKECSETLAYKIQTPGNYPEESIQHTEHGESLKSRIYICYLGRVLLLPAFIEFWFLSEIMVEIQELLIRGLGSEWPPGPCWIMFW